MSPSSNTVCPFRPKQTDSSNNNNNRLLQAIRIIDTIANSRLYSPSTTTKLSLSLSFSLTRLNAIMGLVLVCTLLTHSNHNIYYCYSNAEHVIYLSFPLLPLSSTRHLHRLMQLLLLPLSTQLHTTNRTSSEFKS